MITTYLELEELKKSWKGKVCIFGAGELGRYIAYDMLNACGYSVDFYCDNYISEGTVIRDGIIIRSNQYLYENMDRTLVFLCLSLKYQETVLTQLREHKIKHIVTIDWVCVARILDSIDKANDKVKKKYYAIYDDKTFLANKFKRTVGYDLNIEHPKTFNEKLQWLKLFNHRDIYTVMVDKYAVKKYVSERIGHEYVVPTLGVWEQFDDIDFEKLPKQFVLKCTHDSGSTVLIENKDVMDIAKIREKLTSALNINYYWVGREWPYKNVPRQIIAEKYMAISSEMIDYKFLCFRGIPKMLFTCTERFEGMGLKVTFFDLDWNRLDFERHYPSSKKEISRPKNLELMVNLAGKLSTGIPFVRVDFYEIKGKVYFGEMTFFPGGGMEEFEPPEWDNILGEKIAL